MRLLLDTHTFLWWVNDHDALSSRARSSIADRGSECFVSLTSAWEMAIKIGTGKLELPAPVERFVEEQLAANAFRALPIELSHIARVATLPFHHRDPFDRLLAAQALKEKLTIVSADPVFRKYGVKRIW
jgi:PIN domain nuclease of toxin-antitoxin system